MAKFVHTSAYIQKAIDQTFPFDKLPVWIRRRKFTAHLRSVLFTELYKEGQLSDSFWQTFLLPLVGSLAEPDSGDGVRVFVDSVQPSQEVLKEMKLLKKAEKLEKLLPQFLASV